MKKIQIQRFTGSRRKVKANTMEKATVQEPTSLSHDNADDSSKNPSKVKKAVMRQEQEKKGELTKINVSPAAEMSELSDDFVEVLAKPKGLHVSNSRCETIRLEEDVKEQHRRKFVEVNFPDGLITKYQDKSKHHTAEKFDMCIRVLRNEKDSSVDLLESDHSNVHNIKNKYILDELADGDGNKKTILIRQVINPKKGTTKKFRVVPNEEIFDCIYDVHEQERKHCKNVRKTFLIMKDEFYCVSEKDIANFINTCPVCSEIPCRMPKLFGRNNPLLSSFFRDRAGMGSIEFSSVDGTSKNKILKPIAQVRARDLQMLEDVGLMFRDLFFAQAEELFQFPNDRKALLQYMQENIQKYVDRDCQAPERGAPFVTADVASSELCTGESAGASSNTVDKTRKRHDRGVEDSKLEKKMKKVDNDTKQSSERRTPRSAYVDVRPSAASGYLRYDSKTKHKFLQVRLECPTCTSSRTSLIEFLIYYETAYYEKMMLTNPWFTTNIINAFVLLKMHKHHRQDILYDIVPFATSEPEEIYELPPRVTDIIAIFGDGAHFVFAQINIPNRFVLLKDGKAKEGESRHWEPYVNFLLKRWGIIQEPCSQVIWSPTIVTMFSRDKPTTADGVFEVIPLKAVVQEDDTECGPIACCHAWDLIDRWSKPDDVKSFRKEVLRELISMWNDFDRSLSVLLTMSQAVDIH